jgi:hypothetical protein
MLPLESTAHTFAAWAAVQNMSDDITATKISLFLLLFIDKTSALVFGE